MCVEGIKRWWRKASADMIREFNGNQELVVKERGSHSSIVSKGWLMVLVIGIQNKTITHPQTRILAEYVSMLMFDDIRVWKSPLWRWERGWIPELGPTGEYSAEWLRTFLCVSSSLLESSNQRSNSRTVVVVMRLHVSGSNAFDVQRKWINERLRIPTSVLLIKKQPADWLIPIFVTCRRCSLLVAPSQVCPRGCVPLIWVPE